VVERTARRLLGKSQDLDDAIQASLLAVLRSASRFHGRSSLSTWVTRVTTRTTLRLAQKQRGLVPREAIEIATPPDSTMTRRDALPRGVWEYVEQLPEPQRQAILLRHGLDYSVGDIAEATETSPNTVKYRLKEALAKMRRLVRQDLAVRGADAATSRG
jgi:RNA polymerase sigma-70 factor (ECF subfamily)